MNGRLGCAVVGLGWMGGVRASLTAAMDPFDLLVCCDKRPEAAALCPDGVRFTTSLDEVLNNDAVACVFVSTPDGMHRDIAIAALEAGKHVFCEKPIATTLLDADAMIASARTAGPRLVVGHTLRADGRYGAARAKVASGELGDPIHCVSRRGWPLSQGRRSSGETDLPMFLSVHEFDLVRWVTGREIVAISGMASSVEVDGVTGPPSAVATFRLGGGGVGTHQVTWAIPDSAGMALGDAELTIVGTEGYLSVQVRSEGVVFFGGPNGPTSPVDPADGTVLRGSLERLAPVTPGGGLLGGPYAAEVAAFASSIAGGEILTSGDEARAALACCLAFQTSLREGREVEVDLVASARGAAT